MAAKIKTEVIDALLSSVDSTSELFDEHGLFQQLKKQVLERLLASELTQYLGYAEA